MPRRSTINPQKAAPEDTGDDPDDLWDATRGACRKAMVKAFEKMVNMEEVEEAEIVHKPSELALEYEQNLFSSLRSSMAQYRKRFRKDLIAMRNADTGFGVDLLTGRMEMRQFSALKEGELMSKKQKLQNSLLRERELKRSITERPPARLEDVPIQNTVQRRKWGMEQSAAKREEFDS